MADQFRTTISAVFWTPDPDASTTIVDDVTAQLPEADRDATLTTVEYIAGGRPEPTPPPEVTSDE